MINDFECYGNVIKS